MQCAPKRHFRVGPRWGATTRDAKRVPHGGHGAVARRMNKALGPRNSKYTTFVTSIIGLSPLGQ